VNGCPNGTDDREHLLGGNGAETSHKKIQLSHIMGFIQLGIQHIVRRELAEPTHDVSMNDFGKLETISFPPKGSSQTPAHHYAEFRLKTYAPIVFRYFRGFFRIQPHDFMSSLCTEPLRELSNPAASGSQFYLSDDDKFIIKTVQHQEAEFLPKLLSGYYRNLNQNPHTLLPKFFGLYGFQSNSENVRLVVMNNLLPSSVKIHQKYDFKGAIHNRKLNQQERAKSSPTYRDLDFMEHHPNGIFLESDTYNALVKTIQRDCRLLESFEIMDYSLLVGVHNLDLAIKEKQEKSYRPPPVMPRPSDSSSDESDPLDRPNGIPARNGKGERLLLFIGIIDILQSYRLKRKLEYAYKSVIYGGDTVSVCQPSFYSRRFQNLIANKVFKKIPSHERGRRKLHNAAKDGDLDVVKMLITKGAKIDTIDSLMQTPLHYAAAKGHTNVVDLLIKKGANLNFENHIKETPLHLATENGSWSVVHFYSM
ncbi:phosphatidylinositol 4-phosphate 5-kinase type-1 alpha-like, partial [Sitodiplosis mosellana]|uniref:phosphatidylinositol 4-phosphate 5-kinase type-1 alpha-like n=1 Tax=Sitodiplosis mosellana TaxID=263140 RepID=UPI002443EC93